MFKANKYSLTFILFSEDYPTNEVYIPNFGSGCLCCNKQTTDKKKKRLDGAGKKDYYGGTIDIPICKECKRHVPSNYQPLVPISIFTFIGSVVFLAINRFELHAGTLILLGIGLLGLGFTLNEMFKGKRWRNKGHFPDYYINSVPNRFIFTTNNLSLALKLIELNQQPSIQINLNEELKSKCK